MASRSALTIRVPAALLSRARELKAERESFNDLIVDAVQLEVRRREGMRAYEAILRVRDAVRARTGPQADSASMIRSLRDGSGRRE